MIKREKNKREIGNDYSNFALRLVLICTILILGSSIIFAFRNSFGKEKDTPTEEENKVPDQELINLLYSYVTYNRYSEDMRYFYVNDRLTKDMFDGYEKGKYAFQLVNENNIDNLTENSFTIDENVYQSLVDTIFGKDSSFDNNKEFEVISTNVFKNSLVSVRYDLESKQYIVTKISDYHESVMKPLYSKIIDAYVDDSNDTVTIKEKVIFTSFDYNANGNISKIKVYKDHFHKILIDEVDNNTNNQIEEFNIDNYLDETITVTYKFSLGEDGNYYFESSMIEE